MDSTLNTNCIWHFCHREKFKIGDRQSKADQPQYGACNVHCFATAALQARNCMHNCQIPIEPNESEKQTSTENIEVPHHVDKFAEKLAKHPTGQVLDNDERKREKEHEVSQGEVKQVDLIDAQETPALQEDCHHQAVSRHTQQEDGAVEHSLEHRCKGPEFLRTTKASLFGLV